MRELGYAVAGVQVGLAWESFFSRHGVQSGGIEGELLHLFMAFVIWTVLVFGPARRPKGKGVGA